MDTAASTLTLTLDRGQFLRLPRPAGLCLRVQQGTLWITVDGRPDDLELGPGQRLCLEGAAPVVIGTLGGPARFRAERATAAAAPGARRRPLRRGIGLGRAEFDLRA